MSEKFKNGIKISVGHQAVLELLIKIVFWSITRERLGPTAGLTKIFMPFLNFSDNWLQKTFFFSKQCW